MNTLDMMKIYVDQIKNKEGIVDQKTFTCDLCQCRLTTDQDLRKHMESKHNKWQKAKDNMPEEDILFCCTTCKFETIEEKNLTDHIKDKHENLVCEKCKANFRSRKQLQEHDQTR